MAFASIVKTPDGWKAAQFETEQEAKDSLHPRFGLGAALRVQSDRIGNHVGGNAFVVEVVDGASV